MAKPTYMLYPAIINLSNFTGIEISKKKGRENKLNDENKL